MSMSEEENLKRSLYEWFFKWDGRLEIDEKKQYYWVKDDKWKGDDSDDENLNEEEKTEEQIEEEQRKARQDVADRLKLKKEQEMIAFEERGGFS